MLIGIISEKDITPFCIFGKFIYENCFFSYPMYISS